MPTNALDYITIKGFKSIASVERVRLGPINVLIGANGSGKSNFIGAFAFLRAISSGKLRNYVIESGGAEKLLHFGSKTTKGIYFDLSFAKGTSRYELTLSPTQDDGLYPSDETAHSDSRASFLRSVDEGREAGISGPRQTPWPDINGVSRAVQEHLESWRVYHVHDTSSSSPMRKTARVDDNEFLRADGSNLAAFLYYLQKTNENRYGLIRRTVQQVAPFFDDFRLRPLRDKPDDIKLEWQHKRSDQYFDASSLSDGTLRFMALTTLFLQSGRPPILLVDEPELGLHPYAIGMLASLIRQASVETQIILSTQSSLLLDHFKPEEVLVADRVDGGTRLQQRNATQLAEWLEEYSLGQLWEKNELGGTPDPD